MNREYWFVLTSESLLIPIYSGLVVMLLSLSLSLLAETLTWYKDSEVVLVYVIQPIFANIYIIKLDCCLFVVRNRNRIVIEIETNLQMLL